MESFWKKADSKRICIRASLRQSANTAATALEWQSSHIIGNCLLKNRDTETEKTDSFIQSAIQAEHFG